MAKKSLESEAQKAMAWLDAVQLQCKMLKQAHGQLKKAARTLAMKLTAGGMTVDECAVDIARVIALTD